MPGIFADQRLSQPIRGNRHVLFRIAQSRALPVGLVKIAIRRPVGIPTLTTARLAARHCLSRKSSGGCQCTLITMRWLGWLLIEVTLATADWTQFRGPNGSGVSASKGLPEHFDLQKNVLWRTALPQGHSSPVFTADHIFVTAFEGKTLLTICLDRAIGKVLWRREAPREREENFDHTNGPASPSPVTDGANVYVFFGDFGLLSYGPEGNERWRLPLGPFNNVNGHGSSPILADGKLVLICDQDTGSYLLAVGASSGRVLWKTMRPEYTRGYATPAVYRPKNGPVELIVPGSF